LSCATKGMTTTITLPTPDQIVERINLCRVELAQLKRVLRAIKASEKAEQAHRARPPPHSAPWQEGGTS